MLEESTSGSERWRWDTRQPKRLARLPGRVWRDTATLDLTWSDLDKCEEIFIRYMILHDLLNQIIIKFIQNSEWFLSNFVTDLLTNGNDERQRLRPRRFPAATQLSFSRQETRGQWRHAAGTGYDLGPKHDHKWYGFVIYIGNISINGGSPKSSISIGFSLINHPFWGFPIYGFVWKCWVYSQWNSHLKTG